MARLLFPILIFGLILISCKKDSPPSVLGQTIPAYADQYDSTYTYIDYQPDFGMTLTWDSVNLYGTAYDSLDLDLNGSFDLFVSLKALNPDSAHLLNGAMPNPFPGCILETRNGYEMRYYKESVNIGLGQTTTYIHADALNSGERIDDTSLWIDIVSLWQLNPGGIGTPSEGEWYGIPVPKFLGIRKDGSKFGWLELDASDLHNIVISRFAMQQ